MSIPEEEEGFHTGDASPQTPDGQKSLECLAVPRNAGKLTRLLGTITVEPELIIFYIDVRLSASAVTKVRLMLDWLSRPFVRTLSPFA